MTRFVPAFRLLGTMVAGSLLSSFAFAQTTADAPAKVISLELNTARDLNGGCRMTYIAVNGTETALDKASWQIAVFDTEGRITQFLILQFGSLAQGKTKAVEFDFANRMCSQVSRILVNDVSECLSAGAAAPVCMDGLKTSTRTAIGFGL